MNKKIMTVTEMRRLGKSCTYKVVELDDRDGFKSQSFSFEGCVFKHDITNSDADLLISGKVKIMDRSVNLMDKPVRHRKFFFYGFSIIEIIKYL